jgi:hypothetical protein
MRSGESRYHAGQAEPMEYPRTPLDQSRGTVSGRVVFQNKHFRGRQGWSSPAACPRSVPIDKGVARETSLDKLRLHGNTLLKALSAWNRVCLSNARGWWCWRWAAMIRAYENIVPELSYCEQGCCMCGER